jgi:hypothetical protein
MEHQCIDIVYALNSSESHHRRKTEGETRNSVRCILCSMFRYKFTGSSKLVHCYLF